MLWCTILLTRAMQASIESNVVDQLAPELALDLSVVIQEALESGEGASPFVHKSINRTIDCLGT